MRQQKPKQQDLILVAPKYIGATAIEGAANVEIAYANPNRTRLLVSIYDQVPFDALARSVQLFPSELLRGLPAPFATVNAYWGTVVLRVEDYGQLICGQVLARSVGQESVTVYVWEIQQVRECDYVDDNANQGI